ncbi:hypothetical protein [Pedobacter nyackensis]|uniref:TolB-like 6-blade propeller-like n=1 Tax=Pedobacter nyackensis TaxID=475255 RepID=A0A1W2DL00_9SPHI|nr:hypothetical protein [Pedobacter nyackensis]SMC98093.1 hypothetical protein SAMN04488101_107137 [Pedobacter nyackensis]
MKKTLNSLLRITVITAFISTIALLLMYWSLKKNEVNNGFNRNILAHPLNLLSQIKLDSKQYRFSNSNRDEIIIYDFVNPNKISRISYVENKYSLVHTKIPKIPKFSGPGYAFFDGNEISIINRYSSAIYKIRPGDANYRQRRLDSVVISHVESLSNRIFVLMVPEIKKDSTVLRIIKKTDLKGAELKRYSPQGQSDQFFSNDGFYSYDKASERIIYGYFYRGEFLCLDTNLNLLYKANTIDTNKTAQVYTIKRTVPIGNKFTSRYTQTKPPKFINKSISISNGVLYIQSLLKADNQSAEDFKNNYIVDSYSIEKGIYINSFYIPRIKGKSLSYFKVFYNNLYAIYGDILLIYKISFNNHGALAFAP